MTEVLPLAPSRTRGRPPKLTPAAIVTATRDVLATTMPDDVTFARVARQLGVPISSVYNYFANRNVLLAAVAAEVFAEFRFVEPDPALPWQQRLRAWLGAIDRFFERHPIAFRLMATSSQASPAWIKVRGPLLGALRSLGLEGRELALVNAWFEGQVIGMLLIESHAGRNRANAAAPAEVDLDPGDEAQAWDLERRRHLPSITRDEIVAMGFDALVDALQKRVSARQGAHGAA